MASQNLVRKTFRIEPFIYGQNLFQFETAHYLCKCMQFMSAFEWNLSLKIWLADRPTARLVAWEKICCNFRAWIKYPHVGVSLNDLADINWFSEQNRLQNWLASTRNGKMIFICGCCYSKPLRIDFVWKFQHQIIILKWEWTLQAICTCATCAKSLLKRRRKIHFTVVNLSKLKTE